MDVKPMGLRWSDLASMAGGHLVGSDGPIRGVCTPDSRSVHPGDLFVALPGRRVDGHDFLEQAFDRGAEAAMVSQDRWGDKEVPSGRYILVADVEASLIRLAETRMKQLTNVIAVTGSVGKTTTREMIAKALGGSHAGVYRARQSHNTKIGCALTLAEMPVATSIAVLEMGTNHPGEIAEMVSLFPPDVAVLTKISEAHLEGLGDLNGVVQAKSEIFGSSRLRTVIYNGNDQELSKAVQARSNDARWEAWAVGEGEGKVLVKDRSLIWSDVPTVSVKLELPHQRKGSWTVRAKMSGVHNALLLALAWGTAVHLGQDPGEVAHRLSHCTSCEGRGRLLSLNGVQVLDESYNANPASMSAALDLVRSAPVPKERCFLVLGEMREMGEASKKAHEEILKKAERTGNLYLFGSNWPLRANHRVWKEMDALIEALKQELRPKDLVLIKGSLSNRMERVLEALR